MGTSPPALLNSERLKQPNKRVERTQSESGNQCSSSCSNTCASCIIVLSTRICVPVWKMEQNHIHNLRSDTEDEKRAFAVLDSRDVYKLDGKFAIFCCLMAVINCFARRHPAIVNEFCFLHSFIVDFSGVDGDE